MTEKIVICLNCHNKMTFVSQYDYENEIKDSEGFMIDLETIITVALYCCDKCDFVQLVRVRDQK